jgi:AcrR family transcriptional regulator
MNASPESTLKLLWRNESADRVRPGPRARLTADEVIDTAVEIADELGLDALTIRAVAKRLGSSTMSVYTYVPGKDELLCAMHDQVLAELVDRERDGLEWRAALAEIARCNFELAVRHPWILNVSLSRPPLGPNLLAKYERELRAIEPLPLTDVQKDSVLALMIDIAHSAARAELQRTAGERESGISDSEWWAASEPYLAQMFDESRFPLASRIGAAAGTEHQSGHSPQHALEFGLERALDGVAALIKA